MLLLVCHPTFYQKCQNMYFGHIFQFKYMCAIYDQFESALLHSIQVVVFNSGTCFWFARFSVRMGNVDKNQFNVDGQVISVSQMYEHPDYTSSSSPYYVDMALLRLARPIYYNNRTRPICLATQRAGLQNCYVTGWGHSHFEGSTGKFIMKIEILFVFGCIDNQNHIHTTVWM